MYREGGEPAVSRKVIVGLIVILCVFSGTAALAQSKQPRLGILGVHSTGRSNTYAEYVRNLITYDLVALGRFEVIERGAIDAVLREQRLQLSGVIDELTAVQVGKILGIDIGVIGSLESLEASRQQSYYSAEAVALVRFVDTQTGRLLAVIRVTGSAVGDTLQEAQRRALDRGFGARFQNQVASAFRFRGSVIDVQGRGAKDDVVYISLGRDQGVTRGAEFEVQRAEVTSLTGMALSEEDYIMRTIGTVRVTDTSAGLSRAVVVKSSEPIMQGDAIKEIVRKSPSLSFEDAWKYILGLALLIYSLGLE